MFQSERENKKTKTRQHAFYRKQEVESMARRCFVTGKQGGTGNRVSHSHRKTRRKWGANVQKVRILVDGKPKRVYVSTKALKSGKVTRA